jgi:hypothetical protein
MAVVKSLLFKQNMIQYKYIHTMKRKGENNLNYHII